MADVNSRVNHRNWRRLVEALGGIPWATQRFGLLLQVATRKVDTYSIAKYVLKRMIHSDVAAAFSDCSNQLDLVMKISRSRRIGDAGRPADNRIGRFHEVKRRLTIGIVAHLSCVLPVISTDAIHAPDRVIGRHCLQRQHWAAALRTDSCEIINPYASGY